MTQPTNPSRASGLSTLNEDQIAERGARMARRDDREYREYLREEQRSQPGCPAREMVLDQRGRATRLFWPLIFSSPNLVMARDFSRQVLATHRFLNQRASVVSSG